MARLDKWKVVTDPDRAGKHALVGEVYDHPRFPDGKKIMTSQLDGRIGEAVVTLSGTVYALGLWHDPSDPAGHLEALSVLKELPDAAG